ncbi:hypothetical protein BpHYR1_018759 [Brachionus plicatilis]|uniref:Uncharacterized protein n=1 Tax=Brachionus plicatilis TaxID=10195 RepID=A0A3M7QWM2_BRAPC|nr:hypothetical protein BpHYR1_018759 [Brachionus plicatilis]
MGFKLEYEEGQRKKKRQIVILSGKDTTSSLTYFKTYDFRPKLIWSRSITPFVDRVDLFGYSSWGSVFEPSSTDSLTVIY